MPDNVSRISIDLNSDCLKLIDWLAEYYGETSEGVLKRAVATEAYMTRKTQEGYTFVMVKEGEELKEIKFSGHNA